MYSLDDTRLRLVTEQPFYAMFLNKCIVVYSKKTKTAFVRISKLGDLEMHINEDFLQSLSVEHQVGLLIHEMLHIMWRYFKRAEGLHPKTANYAHDIALNQLFDAHLRPPGALMPQMFGLEKDKSFEEYYNRLMEKGGIPDDPSDGNGQGTLDDHDQFADESNGALDTDKIVREAVESAKRETERRFAPGNVPKHIHGLLEELERAAKVDWRRELARFIARNLSDHSESTRTRADRRLGLAAPGKKKDYVPKVLFMGDHSASVNDEMAAEFPVELKAALRAIGSEKSEVVFFDTEIGPKYKLSAFDKVPLQREKAGGTDFQVAFDYAREVKPDLLVMFTDGECGMPDEAADAPKIPTLWLVVGDSDTSHLRGTVIRLHSI